MEYGIIYIKICPPKGSPGEWIKYCHVFSSTPKSFQENVREIANNINTKHQEDIIIPMDITVHPGCTTTSESVEEIATDMYNQFLDLSENIVSISKYSLDAWVVISKIINYYEISLLYLLGVIGNSEVLVIVTEVQLLYKFNIGIKADYSKVPGKFSSQWQSNIAQADYANDWLF